MKRRLFAPLAIVGLLATLGTAAAACGGDDGGGLTLEVYFQRIEAAQNDRSAQSEALQEEFSQKFSQEFASEEEEIGANQDYFSASIPILRDFVGALGDLDPPDEVKDAHKEAVDAGGEVVRAAEDLADRLADVESTSEMEELFGDPELETIGNRFTQSCIALQGIADANGVSVDLECGDDEQ